MGVIPSFDARDPAGASGQPVAIVGGGASGALMALHLLRASPDLRVVVIEKSAMLGCGVAYSTSDPTHLLNTRVANMSAFADDPAHFLDWLRANVDPQACPYSFASRSVYGQYLAETLTNAARHDRLTCLRTEAIRVVPDAHGATIHLADGGTLRAGTAILATGHALHQPAADSALALPWSGGAAPDKDADILIIGTGLTMVDQVLTLLASGHRGRIEAVSRRGLRPQPHADAAPLKIDVADLPLSQPVSRLMRWLRDRVRLKQAKGGDWRSVVDGLRPHVQQIWQAMDTPNRARFLRHACTWWEVHRHRMPPCSANRLKAAQAIGQLAMRRAAFVGATRSAGGKVTVRLRPTPGGAEEHQMFDRAIDCRGIRRDPERHCGPVIRDLFDSGMTQVDPLRLGPIVDVAGRVLRPDCTPHATLRAIGPVSRAAFWEITAIPDIREQVARMAESLAKAEQVATD